MALMMLPYFDQKQFDSVRAGLFVLTACSNFLPLSHIIFSVDSALLHNFYVFPWILGMALYLIGGLMYATHFPEAYYKK
jgi:predicted membrane channel-forming protein YqfA (hemolysin III family)